MLTPRIEAGTKFWGFQRGRAAPLVYLAWAGVNTPAGKGASFNDDKHRLRPCRYVGRDRRAAHAGKKRQGAAELARKILPDNPARFYGIQ